MTPAGRVNLFGVFGLLLIVVGAGIAFNVLEALVRIFKAHYETGFPSIISLLRTYGVLFLGSVFMLVCGEVVGRRRKN
jgi:hypothetical protein